MPEDAAVGGRLPLSALLSQVLVAFTVEFDNEFEFRMRRDGDKGHVRHSEGFISLAGWLNCVRFLRPEGMTVEEWEPHTRMRPKDARGVLGCLERWGYIVVRPGPPPTATGSKTRVAPAGTAAVRVGFGSSIGAGIKPSSWIAATPRLARALEVWPPLLSEIENRWCERFGRAAVGELQRSLTAIVKHLDPGLPAGLPDVSIFVSIGGRTFRGVGSLFPPEGISSEPARASAPPQPGDPLPLCVLTAKALLAFALEFNRDSTVPIAIGANHLRVLDGVGVPPAEVRRRTGVSNMRNPQHIVALGLAQLVSHPDGKRGKVIRLTASGVQAKHDYATLTAAVERRWATRFGEADVVKLRIALEELLTKSDGARSLLGEGLIPAPGLPRAGDYTAETFAAWPKKVQSNVRDLVRQTRDFVDDPLGTLPHYPIWDGDRGWGP